MSAPLVSVIIPTFNRAALLRRAIESARAQTHRPLEIIVADDGSTDDTAAMVKNFGDTVRYLHQPNRNDGAASARELGSRAAQGEFLKYLDSDDTLPPDSLRKLLTTWQSAPAGCSGAFGDIYEVDAQKPEITSRVLSFVAEGRDYLACLNQPSNLLLASLIRRDVFLETHGHQPHFHASSDWEFMLQVVYRAPLHYAAGRVYDYHRAPGGLEARLTEDIDRWKAETELVLRAHLGNLPSRPERQQTWRRHFDRFAHAYLKAGQRKNACLCWLKAWQASPFTLLPGRKMLAGLRGRISS